MFKSATQEAHLLMRCQSVGRGFSLLSRFAVLVLFMLAFVSPTYSQSYRGTINGTVKDSSGAVIVGATVEVVNADTHFTTPATTNASGLYSAPFLTPGTYSVRVTAKGFAPAEKTEVVLLAADTKQVDVTLSPGTSNQHISVSADEELLQTQNANVESVLTANELHNAPLIAGPPEIPLMYGNSWFALPAFHT